MSVKNVVVPYKITFTSLKFHLCYLDEEINNTKYFISAMHNLPGNFSKLYHQLVQKIDLFCDFNFYQV